MIANQWTESEQVAIKQEQNIGDGRTLLLLIEKDFACLKPRSGKDEDADAFPHPHNDLRC